MFVCLSVCLSVCDVVWCHVMSCNAMYVCTYIILGIYIYMCVYVFHAQTPAKLCRMPWSLLPSCKRVIRKALCLIFRQLWYVLGCLLVPLKAAKQRVHFGLILVHGCTSRKSFDHDFAFYVLLSAQVMLLSNRYGGQTIGMQLCMYMKCKSGRNAVL